MSCAWARPGAGVRSYLAVRGGVGVPPVLGSRSADLRSGLGPAALRPGDVLPVGDEQTAAMQPTVMQPAVTRPRPAELPVADEAAAVSSRR